MESIKKNIEKYLEENGFKLFSMKFITDMGYKILQILVDKNDGSFITTDELSVINAYISELLDQENPYEFEYMLEVSSPGAEKPITNWDELKKAVDHYVMIQTNVENYGTLLEVKDESILLRMNLKGRFKNVEIFQKDIHKMRYAVKF